MNKRSKKEEEDNIIKLRDTRGNESFAIRICMPTKDYKPIQECDTKRLKSRRNVTPR